MAEKYFIFNLSNRLPAEHYEMLNWCRETYGHEREACRWGWDPPLMVFAHEQDLMLFQLRWN